MIPRARRKSKMGNRRAFQRYVQATTTTTTATTTTATTTSTTTTTTTTTVTASAGTEFASHCMP